MPFSITHFILRIYSLIFKFLKRAISHRQRIFHSFAWSIPMATCSIAALDCSHHIPSHARCSRTKREFITCRQLRDSFVFVVSLSVALLPEERARKGGRRCSYYHSHAPFREGGRRSSSGVDVDFAKALVLSISRIEDGDEKDGWSDCWKYERNFQPLARASKQATPPLLPLR